MKIKKLFRQNEEFSQIQPNILKHFALIKSHLCLAKWNLDYPEGWVEIESSLEVVLETFDSNQEKVFFQNGHFLMKQPILGHFMFLK